MTCPFKVGDRVHEVHHPVSVAGPMVLNGIWQLMDPACLQLDSSRPDATVTALIARGFTYRYDAPVQHGRPFWGTQIEGEVYEDGFHMWRLVEASSS